MFGLLKPKMDTLNCSEKSRYNHYYCGLCHGVGSHIGHTWRGIHSNDAVFVALVTDALLDEAAAPSSCRCPMLPVMHRKTRDPSGAAMRYAVAVQMLLGDQWLADKAVDGSTPARLARPLLAGPVERGLALLADLQVDLCELDGFETVQASVEDQHPGPEAASEPTAEALSRVFAGISELPDGPTALRSVLHTFGWKLGRLIHGLDALEDLASDAVRGDYNPCLDPNGRVSPSRTHETIAMVRRVSLDLQQFITAIPWQRNGDLVEHCVTTLCERAEHAAVEAEEQVTEAGLASLQSWVDMPRIWHIAASFLLAFSSLWLGAVSSAKAATQLGAAAIASQRPLAQAAGNDCSNCCDGCQDCGKCSDGCGDSCDQCGDSCDACNDACSGCGDACNGCGNACNSCG